MQYYVYVYVFVCKWEKAFLPPVRCVAFVIFLDRLQIYKSQHSIGSRLNGCTTKFVHFFPRTWDNRKKVLVEIRWIVIVILKLKNLILSKFHVAFESQFHICETGENSTYLRLLQEQNEIIYVKYLEQFLVGSWY